MHHTHKGRLDAIHKFCAIFCLLQAPGFSYASGLSRHYFLALRHQAPRRQKNRNTKITTQLWWLSHKNSTGHERGESASLLWIRIYLESEKKKKSARGEDDGRGKRTRNTKIWHDRGRLSWALHTVEPSQITAHSFVSRNSRKRTKPTARTSNIWELTELTTLEVLLQEGRQRRQRPSYIHRGSTRWKRKKHRKIFERTALYTLRACEGTETSSPSFSSHTSGESARYRRVSRKTFSCP